MSAAIQEMLERYPDLSCCEVDIDRAATMLLESFRSGGQLLVCGNGGSASDSEHIVGELMKGFNQKRPLSDEIRAKFREAYGDSGQQMADLLQSALPAIALTSHYSLVSAVTNDIHPEMAFAQQVYGYGCDRDCLLAISTSGNSRNVVAAVKVARIKGMSTIGLTGKCGGELARWCEVTIRVPYTRTSEVQERHLPIYHALCKEMEDTFFGQDYSGGF